MPDGPSMPAPTPTGPTAPGAAAASEPAAAREPRRAVATGGLADQVDRAAAGLGEVVVVAGHGANRPARVKRPARVLDRLAGTATGTVLTSWPRETERLHGAGSSP